MKQLEKARKYEELYKELFDRNSKVTTICLLLCGVFWVLKLYVLSEQCLILFFFSGGLYGVRRIHREHVQLGEYYLPDQLRTSSICNKVLYKGNVIPVSRANVIDVWILICCLGAATLLLWIECIFGKDIEGTPALIMFYGIVPVICLEYISGFRTVHRRLKRLTWKNFRYHIGWCNIGEKLPKQYKLGNCEITKENRIFFRTYYTVKTTKTNNIYKKVMYCGKEEINIGSVCVLYEICGVRYIQ